MTRQLDLADIQGNIVRPYGRYGFPITRHMFFNIGNAAAGRRFIEGLRHLITTSERWGVSDGDPNPNAPAKPLVAINTGLTFLGMLALELPTRTLAGLPEEFITGMAKRASILGDVGLSGPERWDAIWQNALVNRNSQVHIWVGLNSQVNRDGTPVALLAERTAWLHGLAQQSGGVTVLGGHRGPDWDYQDSVAIMAELPDGAAAPTATEHFGFTDGIGDPTFAGQYEPSIEADAVIGSGKLLPNDGGWAPIATGEFILGHPSEAQELPPSAAPWSFMRNGTFMAYRKLHQNVASFQSYIDQQAATLSAHTGTLTQEAAAATVKAKMVGRWPSGIPLIAAPDYASAKAMEEEWKDITAIQLKPSKQQSANEKRRLADYEDMLTNFVYRKDTEGAACPFAAHMRRVNPRDSLDPYYGQPDAKPGSALTNRRRIMRRGLPYGNTTVDNHGEHGVIFMAFCASLFRQFEFIQQQWVNYGSSFESGNDTDPLVGNHYPNAKFVIPADPAGDGTPFVCANLPQFVETRGGDYFFIPSLTALREIAKGSVDPT